MARNDATFIRKTDSLHRIMGVIYPNRADNEAYISETIDTTNIDKYVAEKNASDPAFKYTMFHVIVAVMLKTLVLRPKLNRFFQNRNYYQKNDISAAFVVKKVFSEKSEEALAIVRVDGNDTFETIHDKIFKTVSDARSEKGDVTTQDMDLLNKLPQWLFKLVMSFFIFLDRHGWLPKSLVETDSNYSSVFLSNVGSIHLKSGYHHLSNWGTASVFVLVGEKKIRPFFNDDGSYEMKPSVQLGLTIDERIADGYYYAGCIRLMKKLFENPELLDKPLSETFDY